MFNKVKAVIRASFNTTLVNHGINVLSVILGVYLAFYMNERAQHHKDIQESVVLMNSMIEELSEDISIYEDYQIPVNTHLVGRVEAVIQLLVQDSLAFAEDPFSELLNVENYFPSMSTYNSMKASGKVHLMNDLPLQKQLSSYYEGLAEETKKKGELQVEYFMNEIVSWMTLHVDLLEMELRNEQDMFALKNKLVIYSSLIHQKVESYTLVVEKSKALKVALQNKINSL